MDLTAKNITNISGNDLLTDISCAVDTSIHPTAKIDHKAIFYFVLGALEELYPDREITCNNGKIWIDKVERFKIGDNFLYNLLQLCNALKNEIY